MQDKAKAGDLRVVNNGAEAQKPAKRRRWDVAGAAEDGAAPAAKKKSSWDAAEATTPSNSRWDETPGRAKGIPCLDAVHSVRCHACLWVVVLLCSIVLWKIKESC